MFWLYVFGVRVMFGCAQRDAVIWRKFKYMTYLMCGPTSFCTGSISATKSSIHKRKKAFGTPIENYHHGKLQLSTTPPST